MEERKEYAAVKKENPLAEAPQQMKTMQLSRNNNQLTDAAAWELATRIKTSSIIPKDFIGKPENIFIAILMGREVGLPAIQAVQNIMVVNGRPCMWGDALPALVYASDKVEKFEEEIDAEGKWAKCTVRRKGETKDHVQIFTWADAVKAGYDKKQGPWQTSPKRMLQMRARAFALRDKFSDVLKGLGMVEEAQDYESLEPKHISMPKEIAEIQTKAETFSAQEGEVVPQPQTTTETATPEKSVDLRIAAAKNKFLQEYKVDGDIIDRYLEWHKLPSVSDQYMKLQETWRMLKNGKTTVEIEFDRFKIGNEPETANIEELPF